MPKEKKKIYKKNKRKKLTNIEYTSIITGCLITFFIAIFFVHLVKKETIPIFSIIGEALVPSIIAIIISLITRSPTIGIGITSFLFIKGFLYIALEDIHQLPPLEASRLSTFAFLVVMVIGGGLCFLIKKVLILDKQKKLEKNI